MKLNCISFLLLLSPLLFSSCETNSEKTAYVNNTEILQGYYKMKAAKKEFEQKNEKLIKEIDSISNDLRIQIESYRMNEPKMTAQQKENEQERLIGVQNKLQREQQQKSRSLEEESEEVIEAIVKEVRDKIAKYGERNNYDYIFGSNESANILYAKKGKDITLEVLEVLNNKKED
jgi:outer membrane protein